MVEKNSPEEKRAAEQPRTAQVGAQDKGQGGDEAKASDEPRSAAAKVLQVDAGEVQNDPYPAYDLMSLDELRSLAGDRSVSMPADVEKAQLISALRAADTAS